jgi:glutaredoxin
MTADTRVRVLTRPGCHLCEDACREVARITADLGVGWVEEDITGDEALTAEWSEYVPVLVVDGVVHDWFRVNESRLRAALS